MPVQNFTASVQYDDFKGTAAADRADHGDASDWLEKKGLKQNGEFLLGFTLTLVKIMESMKTLFTRNSCLLCQATTRT